MRKLMGLDNPWDIAYRNQTGFVTDVHRVVKHIHRRFLQANTTLKTNTTSDGGLPDNSPDRKTQLYLEEKERQRLEEERKKREEEALLANETGFGNRSTNGSTKDKFQASYPTLLTNEQIQYGGFLIYLAGK